MRQSHLFTKTRKTTPKDEVAKNAQLLIRGGFIHKEMAGVYDYLPLGLRVIEKIEQVIREEMNAIGGQEMVLTALQDPTLWSKTDRWNSAAGVWFTTKLSSGADLGLAFTHEEPLTALMTEYISSYKDLPRYVYQFQTKFRNEVRAKSGILRTREFVMKDLYSFSKDEAHHAAFYEKAVEAYKKIFQRVGIGDKTFMTIASGGDFSPYSHEFQTVCDAGEDLIYIDDTKGMAVNKEILDDEKVFIANGLDRSTLREAKAIEVGNIFSLGTRFSEALGLKYKDETGKEIPVVMGSYGIGPGRLMGTIVEVLSDERGIVWPKEVAPYQVHLISITNGNAEVTKEADQLYEVFDQNGIETFYDDRDVRAGEKFADADLIGIPTRVIVSEKTMGEGGVEVSMRGEGSAAMISDGAIVDYLKK
ncbi:MAG: aminoacyl--tRNA ligase-related protein [bacterium]|nr:aminoacyl--tRNA ligase-related protein [bacterium]